MLLSQIEAFLTVAERRSVSAAAAALYVTQPALTTRLKKLERELGVELFVRTPRGMRLTAEGRAFRPHAQRAVQALASGRELLRELREGRVGELLVGAAPAISTYVLPLVLRRFQADFPNVHLIVRTGHSEEVLELVLREQVQVGLVRELPHAAVVSSPLYEDEIVLVVHPGHRFADEPSIVVHELGAERLILFDRTSSYFVLTSAFFREAGVVPRGVMELDNVDATKKMVEHGLGIAFLPYTAVRGGARLGSAAGGRDRGLRAGAPADRRPAAPRRGHPRGPRRRPARRASAGTSSSAAPSARSSRGPSRPARR